MSSAFPILKPEGMWGSIGKRPDQGKEAAERKEDAGRESNKKGKNEKTVKRNGMRNKAEVKEEKAEIAATKKGKGKAVQEEEEKDDESVGEEEEEKVEKKEAVKSIAAGDNTDDERRWMTSVEPDKSPEHVQGWMKVK